MIFSVEWKLILFDQYFFSFSKSRNLLKSPKTKLLLTIRRCLCIYIYVYIYIYNSSCVEYKDLVLSSCQFHWATKIKYLFSLLRVGKSTMKKTICSSQLKKIFPYITHVVTVYEKMIYVISFIAIWTHWCFFQFHIKKFFITINYSVDYFRL